MRHNVEGGEAMPLLGRKPEEEKQAAAEAKDAHTRSLPKWRYKVIRVGEDKQKGLLGSGRMESLFNDLGAQGWELVAVSEERATFKLQLPP
jgi:hypothetical protein